MTQPFNINEITYGEMGRLSSCKVLFKVPLAHFYQRLFYLSDQPARFSFRIDTSWLVVSNLVRGDSRSPEAASGKHTYNSVSFAYQISLQISFFEIAISSVIVSSLAQSRPWWLIKTSNQKSLQIFFFGITISYCIQSAVLTKHAYISLTSYQNSLQIFLYRDRHRLTHRVQSCPWCFNLCFGCFDQTHLYQSPFHFSINCCLNDYELTG